MIDCHINHLHQKECAVSWSDDYSSSSALIHHYCIFTFTTPFLLCLSEDDEPSYEWKQHSDVFRPPTLKDTLLLLFSCSY